MMLKQAHELKKDNEYGFVYFAKSNLGNYIKIGKSNDLYKRIDLISRGTPFGVSLIGYVKTNEYSLIELSMHKHFSSMNINNEWFEISISDIIDYFDSGCFKKPIINKVKNHIKYGILIDKLSVDWVNKIDSKMNKFFKKTNIEKEGLFSIKISISMPKYAEYNLGLITPKDFSYKSLMEL